MENNVWRGLVEKLCLRTEISCVSRGNKVFGNLLNVNFVRKRLILHQNITVHQLSISDEKMLLLTK